MEEKEIKYKDLIDNVKVYEVVDHKRKLTVYLVRNLSVKLNNTAQILNQNLEIKYQCILYLVTYLNKKRPSTF